MSAFFKRVLAKFSRPASESNQEAVWFLTIAGLVGFLVGLAAAFLSTAIHWLAELFRTASDVFSAGSQYIVVFAVPLGLTAAWWIAHRFSPESSGGGVPETVEALVVRNGYLATKSIFYKLATTILTLGSGVQQGERAQWSKLEGPLVLLFHATSGWEKTRFEALSLLVQEQPLALRSMLQ